MVAGSLLTFIPAVGDFVNARIVGTTNQYMIGNLIESRFLRTLDYAEAAGYSFVLMAIVLVIVLLYTRVFGTEDLADAAPVPVPHGWGGARLPVPLRADRRHRAVLVQQAEGNFNFTWQEFSLDAWANPFRFPEVRDALFTSLRIAGLATLVSTVLGTLVAFAMTRYASAAGASSTSC